MRDSLYAILIAGVACCAAKAQVVWPSVARSWSHTGVSNATTLPLGHAENEIPTLGDWIAAEDEHGQTFTAIPSQTPAFDADRLYIFGRVATISELTWKVLAIRRSDGGTVWSRSIPSPAVDSFASAAVDVARARVIAAAGRDVICFDAASGAEVWRRTLTRNVVNASPIIADEVPGQARAFITDYDGYGVAASLYCINIDPRSATNPFDPGEIVWRVAIGGASGATPAFLPADSGGTGLVYIATRGEPSFMPGAILAYDAHATTAPAPAFITSNVIDEGFYGPISIAPPKHAGEAPRLYAVSYEFYGGLKSANLLAVNGATGAIHWSVPSNRGAAAPVVLGDGRIAVSGGVQGFGSLPSVALYLDRGDQAVPLWNSVLDSWVDADGDELIDLGECQSVGLWSYQPVASRDLRLLCVGVAPNSPALSGFGSSMATVDLALWPRDRLFCRRTMGMSGSPSAGRGWFYGIGASGLTAFSMPRIDVNSDGHATIDDVYAFERGAASLDRRDVDGDTLVTGSDRTSLIFQLRVHESARMTTRRP